ncbi:growth hormone receptor a, partial [Aplochiton taeniatus]
SEDSAKATRLGSTTSSDSSVQGPHFTECVSKEQETFRCRWSVGSFQNLSEPGVLRVFYLKRDISSSSDWKECPHYTSTVKNECYFDRNHTAVWRPYYMELRSPSQNITYDHLRFSVENIVHPDPPVSLNWTLLNVSRSGLYYDIMMRWEPPPSADVQGGWISLQYEVQHRIRNSTLWDAVSPTHTHTHTHTHTLESRSSTIKTLYGLRTGEEYEVRMRSRMGSFPNFGEFSESIFVHVPEIPSKDSSFPIMLVLIFGTLGVVILLIIIVFYQQQRLMLILLPPIPAPKIKGIDPELLKKGKLDELNFILSGGGMEGLSSYPPDMYQDDPWVEFIEVDADDDDRAEKEENQSSDTQRLLAVSSPSHHTHQGCSHRCYDSELLDPEALMTSLLPGQPDRESPSLEVPNTAPEGRERPQVQTQLDGPKSWVNIDFYAQVSEVMPSGGVVLSPGQQPRTLDKSLAADDKKRREEGEKRKAKEEQEKRREKQQQVELPMDPDGGAYTTESSTRHICIPNSSPVASQSYHALPSQPLETKPQSVVFVVPGGAALGCQSPYILPDSPPAQFLPPVSDYTVVQELDCQHSILLNPPSQQSNPPCVPQYPTKPLHTMPLGYLSPDLLGNLAP